MAETIIKYGDVLDIRVRVESYGNDGDIRVSPINGWSDCYVRRDENLRPVSCAFSKGDWITVIGEDEACEILLIEDDQLVIHNSHAGLRIVQKRHACRALKPEIQEAAE